MSAPVGATVCALWILSKVNKELRGELFNQPSKYHADKQSSVRAIKQYSTPHSGSYL